MPATEVLYYRGAESVPLLDWLDGLQLRARYRCLARLKRLEDCGHELRRPIADYLGAGIYELRAACEGVNYRMLYFFHGRSAAVVSHGFVKQRATVPLAEIQRTVERKRRFEETQVAHTFKPGL